MRSVLLSVLVAAPVFASGMSVCKEWGFVYDSEPAAVDAGMDEDGGAAGKETDDGGSIYRSGQRRCLRYGFEPYDRGCSSVPGESLVLLALLVARWRR